MEVGVEEEVEEEEENIAVMNDISMEVEIENIEIDVVDDIVQEDDDYINAFLSQSMDDIIKE